MRLPLLLLVAAAAAAGGARAARVALRGALRRRNVASPHGDGLA
jgi:hypothetical protein